MNEPNFWLTNGDSERPGLAIDAYVPKLLGLVVAISGLGYLLDSLVAVLSGDSLPEAFAITAVGELLPAFWLVIWDRPPHVARSSLPQDHIAVG